MNNFNRILVGADLSEMDAHLLQALKFLSELYNPEKAYVLHISPDLEIPEFAQEIYENVKRIPLDEQIELALQQEVDENFPEAFFPIEVNVVEGPLTEQLLRWTAIKDINLTIVGRKDPEFGTGVAIKRLLRKSSSSVLFVPPKSIRPIRKILVPSDYSSHSIHALKEAINLAHILPETPELIHLFGYNIPSEVHFKIMRSRAQFEQMMEREAEEYYENFIKKIDTGGLKVQPQFIQNAGSNPARDINSYAEKNEIDLIIMGAQGHSALESVLLGSVTERLLMINHNIPTLILRLPK